MSFWKFEQYMGSEINNDRFDQVVKAAPFDHEDKSILIHQFILNLNQYDPRWDCMCKPRGEFYIRLKCTIEMKHIVVEG